MAFVVHESAPGLTRPLDRGECGICRLGTARFRFEDLEAAGIGRRVTILRDTTNRLIGLRRPAEDEHGTAVCTLKNSPLVGQIRLGAPLRRMGIKPVDVRGRHEVMVKAKQDLLVVRLGRSTK